MKLFVVCIWIVVCLVLQNSYTSSAELVEEFTEENVPKRENQNMPVSPEQGTSDSFEKVKLNDQNQTTTSPIDARVDYKEELKLEQLRQKKMNDRKQEGMSAVKRTINAASTEACDWKTQPVAFIKGEVCGSHYKILGIDRRSKLVDKSKIKKKYRQLSLQLHPDKNPSLNAEDAFNMLQGAYDCISDDECKDFYDQKLVKAEEEIFRSRQQLKKLVIDKSTVALHQAHYYISLAANKIYQVGMSLWDTMGEWQVTVFEETYPLGRPLAMLLLLWKGQFLLKLHVLSYVIIRINHEIAKARGWM